MNQTMDIISGILNISALPLEKFQLPKFAGCIHAVALKAVTSDIITRLARASHGHAWSVTVCVNLSFSCNFIPHNWQAYTF